MDGTVLLKEIADLLKENREQILMDHQFKHCGPCGGSRVDLVYRSPAAYKIGRLLDAYYKENPSIG